MTDIAFHFNVSDKLFYGCRLLRKAYLGGARVAVTAEPELLAELDRLLWTFSPADFVPHCAASACPISLANTPIVLTGSPADCSHRDVLVNLGQEIPAEFEGFERFIEVVALSPADLRAGRSRWKQYAARGYAMQKYDLAGSAA